MMLVVVWYGDVDVLFWQESWCIGCYFQYQFEGCFIEGGDFGYFVVEFCVVGFVGGRGYWYGNYVIGLWDYLVGQYQVLFGFIVVECIVDIVVVQVVLFVFGVVFVGVVYVVGVIYGQVDVLVECCVQDFFFGIVLNDVGYFVFEIEGDVIVVYVMFFVGWLDVIDVDDLVDVVVF